jgi:hypothetical protein
MTALDSAFVAAILMQVLDGFSTLRALQSGKGREANPVIAWFIDRFGLVPAMIITKGAGVALAAALWSGGWFMGLSTVALIYAVVVWRNFKIGG